MNGKSRYAKLAQIFRKCVRRKIQGTGKAAQARIQVGKRVLWHLPRIYQYLEQAATDK